MSELDKRIEEYSNSIVLLALQQAESLVKKLKGEEEPKGVYELGYRDAIDTAIIMIRRIALPFQAEQDKTNE